MIAVVKVVRPSIYIYIIYIYIYIYARRCVNGEIGVFV